MCVTISNRCSRQCDVHHTRAKKDRQKVDVFQEMARQPTHNLMASPKVEVGTETTPVRAVEIQNERERDSLSPARSSRPVRVCRQARGVRRQDDVGRRPRCFKSPTQLYQCSRRFSSKRSAATEGSASFRILSQTAACRSGSSRSERPDRTTSLQTR